MGMFITITIYLIPGTVMVVVGVYIDIKIFIFLQK